MFLLWNPLLVVLLLPREEEEEEECWTTVSRQIGC